MEYYPTRPNNPYQDDCRPKPDCGCTPPPTVCPPQKPPVCQPPQPVMGQIPPVPTVIEGSSLYEAMGKVIERTNMCINQWNCISKNCYEAMNACVAAARSNDVYYDDCEVNYQEGYDTTEGCAYAIVEKKAVDRKGKPIFVSLAPAYDNTTNSGVEQGIFDMSFIKSANVIMTAVQAGSDKWFGPAMYRGAAIPGETKTDGYVYGFNRHGALRYFKGDVTETTLCQNQMVDVIGGCVPILYDGKVIEGVEAMTQKQAICAIGFNCGTGSVFFFSCSAQNQPGMGIASVARILQGYGCTTAVVTSATTNTPAATGEGMLYMGQMTTDPVNAKEPKNLAYWVISKCPNFNNAFQKEVADLVQTTGRNAWETYLLGVQIQSFDDRITQNAKDIAAEIERAKAAEKALDNKIEAETNRAEAAEDALDKKIDAETERATAAETALDNKIVAETNRATAAENKIASDLQAEVVRATTRENQIQAALDAEIKARIDADNDLINAIEQEVLARKAADVALENKIDAVDKKIQTQITNIEGNITNLETQINGMTTGQTNLPYLKLTGGQLSGNLTFTSGSTVVAGRAPTADNEVATKKYVDDAVQTGGGGTGTDVSKEYVDQQIANVQGQVNTKVSKSGDTMTGSLNFNGNTAVNPVLESNSGIKVQSSSSGAAGKVTNLAAPSADSDAANKKYVDDGIKQVKQEISGELGGEYLALTGGDMTGDINMTGNSVVKFYDPIAARARAKNLTDQMVKGSVYNDADAMVVKSETGPVALKGTDVSLSNGEGGEIAISGVTEIRRKKNDPNSGAVKLNDDLINLAADTVLVGQNGSMQGEVSMGTLNLYDDTGAAVLKRHNSHLDINVPDALGSVYINRNQTEGGTGEIHVTEVHAPNELRLNPGTTINMMSKRVVGMANGVNSNDAVNVAQLGAVRTIAQNAQSAANNASSKADQALEKAESVGYNSYPCTATESDDALTIKGKVISYSTGEEVEVTVDINNYLKSQSNFIKAWVSNGIIYILGTLQLSGNISVHLSNLRGKNFVYPEITLYGLSGTSASHHVATVKSSLIEWEFPNGNVLQYVTVISGQDMTPLLV
mgnify:CR=1 FL=1